MERAALSRCRFCGQPRLPSLDRCPVCGKGATARAETEGPPAAAKPPSKPSAPPAGPRGGTCPACGQALRSVMLSGVVLDRCYGCGGRWFDKGELARVLGLAKVPAAKGKAPAGASGDLRCVRCGGPLQRRALALGSDVVAAMCYEHGVWMAGADYDRAREAAQAKRKPSAVPPKAPRAGALHGKPRAARRLRAGDDSLFLPVRLEGLGAVGLVVQALGGAMRALPTPGRGAPPPSPARRPPEPPRTRRP